MDRIEAVRQVSQGAPEPVVKAQGGRNVGRCAFTKG
jgi:hypothetical protein